MGGCKKIGKGGWCASCRVSHGCHTCRGCTPHAFNGLARLLASGRLGNGKQALPWIHGADQIGSILFLLNNPETNGVFNIIAPQMTTHIEFMRTLAKILKRPYWFPFQYFYYDWFLGKMSVLVTEGRFSKPKCLLKNGYTFHFPELEDALEEIYSQE